MRPPQFERLRFERVPLEESRARLRAFRDLMRTRRTVREYATDAVPQDLIDMAIEAAASAPSGANRQPWRFVVVRDPEARRRIRETAEAEEKEFYQRRAPAEWLEALAPLGTDWRKPFLTDAPVLIAVFRLDYEPVGLPDGTERHRKNYYVSESVGIGVGMLLAALHAAGLATLTHTPSPMGFLGHLLGRPRHERPYLLIPVGYPAPGARVPLLTKKTLDEVRELI